MFPFFTSAQVPRDTSFTLHSAYQKAITKWPSISPAIADSTYITIHRDVVYKSIAGRKLLADIYYKGSVKKRKPAVLLLFGGGWKSGDKSMNRAMALDIAAHGYVVVSIEYRLAAEARFPAAYEDVVNALYWMKLNSRLYGIKKERLAVAGTSAGAQLASLVGTINNKYPVMEDLPNKKYKSLVQAVVNIDGVLAFHHPQSREGEAATAWFGGSYLEKPLNWKRASALEHVHAGSAAHLFISSSQPRFQAGREDMIEKLAAFNIYYEEHSFDDSPHTFWLFNPWFRPTVDTIIGFLDKQLKR